MRMFCTNTKPEWSTLFLTEDRIIKHAKVVRLSEWQRILVQNFEWNITMRHTCEVISIQKKWIHTHILRTEKKTRSGWTKWMIIWVLHSFEKMADIVKKLTEIWISRIVFWSSDFSQTKKLSDKKMSKLSRIALESVEQSNGRLIPEILFISNLSELQDWFSAYLFDFSWMNVSEFLKKNTDTKKKFENIYWIVGPEWHFSKRDLEEISHYETYKLVLWKQILRTETAAIVWARCIMNVI